MPSAHIYTSASMATGDLQLLIDTAEPGTTIHLAAGTYTFTQTLLIDRSDISVVGAGSEKTIIQASKGLMDAPVIQVGHDIFRPDTIDSFQLVARAAAGSTQISVEAGHDLSVGDYIYVTQKNTAAFFAEIGDRDWQKESPLRTVLAKVTSVDGKKVTFDTPLPFDFDPAITTVEHRDIQENNTLTGFTVVGAWGQADPSDFNNRLGTETGATAILIAGTSNAKLTDIAVLDSASNGITIANSTHLEMTDIIVDGAHDKGDSGNGYAIWIRDVYESTFSQLALTDTRHAVVFASHSSAVGNTVHVTTTNRDINFHGGLDQNNTVVVDESIRTGAEMNYMAPTVFFNQGTTYGAPTDPTTNSVSFATIVGTVRSEEVTVADKGSLIAMMGGADIVHTGGGDDIVDLGTGRDIVYASGGRDTLVGGNGRDTVVFAMSEQNYTIAWHDNTLVVSHGAHETRLREFETVTFGDASYQFADVKQSDLVVLPQYQSPEVNGLKTVAGANGWQRETVSESVVMGANLEAIKMVGSADLTAVGNVQNNNILANAGDNLIDGAGGHDRIFGRAGDDVIFGGDGNDFLYGQAGDDTLVGGSGNDILIGGFGADVFVGSSGLDKIADFNTAEGDWIHFNADVDGKFDAAFDRFQKTGQNSDGFEFSYVSGDLHIHFEDSTLVLQDTVRADFDF